MQVSVVGDVASLTINELSTSALFAYKQRVSSWNQNLDFHRVDDAQTVVLEQSPFLQDSAHVLLCLDDENSRMTASVLKKAFFERALLGKTFPETVFLATG